MAHPRAYPLVDPHTHTLALGDWESAATWLQVVNQATSQVAKGTATMTSLSGTVAAGALNEAARVGVEQPLIRVNRARSAALLDKGYQLMAWYEGWRPWIFLVAAASAGASGYMVWRRKRVPEAWPLYLVIGGVAAGVAWITRPEGLRAAPAPVPPTPENLANPPPGTLQQILGWLDRHVAQRSQQQPGWEAGTFRRIAGDLGFDTMPQYAETFLTRNSL